MPTYQKSEDWLRQTELLLEARPETTRITTRYNIKPAIRRRRNKAKAEAGGENATAQKDTAESAVAPATEKPPRGHLLLKTFDPASGVTLKYKTSKAAEVSRLVQLMGVLGRRMAALPPAKRDDTMPDAPVADDAAAATAAGGSGTQTPVVTAQGSRQQPAQQVQQGPGGGKGKKKKGKR